MLTVTAIAVMKRHPTCMLSSTSYGIWYVHCVHAPNIYFIFGRVETSRFDNFSGLSCARLTRTQSLRGGISRKQTKLFRLFSLFFFNTPKKYTALLNGIYVDRIVFQAPFRQFVERATSGWQQDVINVGTYFTTFNCITNMILYTGSSLVQCKYCILSHPACSPSEWRNKRLCNSQHRFHYFIAK